MRASYLATIGLVLASLTATALAAQAPSATSKPAELFVNKQLTADERASHRQDLDAVNARSSLTSYREEAQQRAQKAVQEKEEDLRKADQRAGRGSVTSKNRFRTEILQHPHRRAYVLSRHMARMDRVGNQAIQEKTLAQDEASAKLRDAEQLKRDVKELETALLPLAQAAVHLQYEQDRSFLVTFQQTMAALPAAARTLSQTKDADLQSEASKRIEDAFSEVTETLARRDPRFTAMALTHFQPGLRAGLSHQGVKSLALYVADAWKAVKSNSETEASLTPEAIRASEYWLAEAKAIEPAEKQATKPAATTEQPKPPKGGKKANRAANRKQQ